MSPLRTLAAIMETPARVRAVGHRLDRLGSDGFVAALDELARDAALGATPADTDAMLACALWLLSDPVGSESSIDELVARAQAGNHEVALALLDDGPAHKALAPKGRLADHGKSSRVLRYTKEYNPTAREVASAFDHVIESPTTESWMVESFERFRLSILAKEDEYPAEGYWSRIALSRTEIERQVDRQLEHLSRRPDAASIARVLDGRDTTKKHVVRIAARRPTTPAIVGELVARPEWMAYPEIRNAVVENPFTPLRTALLLLPTCRVSLNAIARTKADVHPRLALASRLLLKA